MAVYSFSSLAVCTDGEVRLMISEEPEYFYTGEAAYDPIYTDKDGLRVGRVEVCSDGQYRTVCYDMWDNSAATVVCRDLGFSPYGKRYGFYRTRALTVLSACIGAIGLSADIFNEGDNAALLSNVDCVGNESHILDCQYELFDRICPTAAVICQC